MFTYTIANEECFMNRFSETGEKLNVLVNKKWKKYYRTGDIMPGENLKQLNVFNFSF